MKRYKVTVLTDQGTKHYCVEAAWPSEAMDKVYNALEKQVSYYEEVSVTLLHDLPATPSPTPKGAHIYHRPSDLQVWARLRMEVVQYGYYLRNQAVVNTFIDMINEGQYTRSELNLVADFISRTLGEHTALEG